jgi:hypothetical protein
MRYDPEPKKGLKRPFFHSAPPFKPDRRLGPRGPLNPETAPREFLARLQQILGAEEFAEVREEVVKRALQALRG